MISNLQIIFTPTLKSAEHLTWADSRLIPAYIASSSVLFLLLESLWRSAFSRRYLLLGHLWKPTPASTGPLSFNEEDNIILARSPEPDLNAGLASNLKRNFDSVGLVVFLCQCIRLASCLSLLGISATAVILKPREHPEDSYFDLFSLIYAEKSRSHINWAEVVQALYYLYLSILATFAIALSPTSSLQRRATPTLSILLAATCLVYGYRDIWPLVTYTMPPQDADDGWLTWSRIGLAFFAGVFVPLVTPRIYVPIDPKNPNTPNGEQTASPLRFALFMWLDPLIYRAWKEPHLPYDTLPGLCDYDRSKYLVDKAFPILEYQRGKKNRHLGLRLVRVFRKELALLAVLMIIRSFISFVQPIAVNQLLKYMETSGENPFVRPWVWIAGLFLSPFFAAVLFEAYVFISTSSTVRLEGILTQLIFEHSLKIRMREDGPAQASSSAPATATTTAIGTPVIQSQDLPEDEGNDSAENPSSSQTAALATSASDATVASSPAAETAPSSSSSSSPTTHLTGRINNLISTDLDTISNARDILFGILFSPVQIIFASIFLYTLLGASALVGIGSLVLGLGVPGRLALIVRWAQIGRMKATDERVQDVSEVFSVIRMIKMFGWEEKTKAQIRAKRDTELWWLRMRFLLTLLNNIVTWIIPMFSMLATFFTYTLILKKPLDASTVYTALTTFDILKDHIHYMFWALPNLVAAMVSMERIDDFLAQTELLDEFESSSSDESTPSRSLVAPTVESTTIGFHNATFTWSSSIPPVSASFTPGTSTPITTTPNPKSSSRRNFVLRVNGDITFKPGALNLIVGPTGSGKTSLLLALLGEMHFAPKDLDAWFSLPREGGIAYAAQEPWVMNETIRDNIVFGDVFDEERYKAVMYQCALERDLELFEGGDQTEVGEKGLTLSGGQKARVSLARAVYSKAQIVLLDDVLSALDVHTARWVADKCLAGSLLHGRTVILVTHSLALTSRLAQNVIEIASNGQISQRASVSDALEDDPTLKVEIEAEHETLVKADEIVDGTLVPSTKADVDHNAGKLIAEEEIAIGHVSASSMMLYFKNMGGIWYWVMLWAFLFASQYVNVILAWWLGVWAHQYEIMDDKSVPVPYYLTRYALLMLAFLTIYSGYFVSYTFGIIRASQAIHELLVASVLSAPLRFFDKTPMGRIIARFTKDVRSVDGTVSHELEDLCWFTAILVLKLGAIVYFTPVFIWPGLAIGLMGYILGNFYIAAQLSVKREMSNSRSPVFSHFGASINGVTSIRAYGAQNVFKGESLKRIDTYSRPARVFYTLHSWIGIRIETLGGIFTSGLAGYLVYVSRGNNASESGLQLNMAVGFTSLLLWWIRTLNELEIAGNSLERIQDYLDIEQEPKPVESGKPPASWPTSGNLAIDKLGARYSHDGPEVLHSLSFSVQSGEKVGIVGRTGSGKSSLTLSLLRLIPTSGEVLYDGEPTSRMNLEDLRSAITIIPQQPELLSGTIRQNLDPFDTEDDATLNAALQSAGLFTLQKDIPEEGRITLDSVVGSAGGNFSLGQRQILALARALVRRSKVLILDEATASLDHDADALVQRTLATAFNDCTIITVAHRLQTIMNSNKILVLDAGNIVEFDSPANLLRLSTGIFKDMVDRSGDKEALYELVNF